MLLAPLAANAADPHTGGADSGEAPALQSRAEATPDLFTEVRIDPEASADLARRAAPSSAKDGGRGTRVPNVFRARLHAAALFPPANPTESRARGGTNPPRGVRVALGADAAVHAHLDALVANGQGSWSWLGTPDDAALGDAVFTRVGNAVYGEFWASGQFWVVQGTINGEVTITPVIDEGEVTACGADEGDDPKPSETVSPSRNEQPETPPANEEAPAPRLFPLTGDTGLTETPDPRSLDATVAGVEPASTPDEPSWWDAFVDAVAAALGWETEEPVDAPAASSAPAMQSMAAPPGQPTVDDTIDVLAVYTKEARALKGNTHEGMRAYLYTVNHVTNRIWERSGISSHRVRFVEMVEVNSTGPNDVVGPSPACVYAGLYDRGVAEHDADKLRCPDVDDVAQPLRRANDRMFAAPSPVSVTSGSQVGTSVPLLRASKGADVVTAFFSRAYGGAIGSADVGDPTPQKGVSLRSGMASSVGQAATVRWSFAHELSHMLGNQHQADSVDPAMGGAGFRQVPVGAAPGFATLVEDRDSSITPRLPLMATRFVHWEPGAVPVPDDPSLGVRVDGVFHATPGAGRYTTGDAQHREAEFVTTPYPIVASPSFGLTPLEVVAAWQPAVPPPGAPPLLTPAPFSDVATTSATFTWSATEYARSLTEFHTDPSDTDASTEVVYVLEVGNTLGGAERCTREVPASAVNVSTGVASFTVDCLPGTLTPFFIRFWTQVLPATWVFEDFRYNTALRLVSCASEDASFAPSSHAAASCDITSGSTDVCTVAILDGTRTLRCDLSVISTGTIAADATIVNTWGTASGAPYEYVAFGEARNGTDFCCLYDEIGGRIGRVFIDGSPGDDLLSFLHLVSYDLEPTSGSTGLVGRIRGGGGNDVLVGSRSTSSLYQDWLNGEAGNDTVSGMEGADFLSGGHDNDVVNGGDGVDVLLTGPSGYDELRGGDAADYLCSSTKNDLLVGSDDIFDFEVNRLYVSAGSAPAPNSASSAGGGGWSLCGHNGAGYGTTWANDGTVACNYTLATAPTQCTNASLPFFTNQGIPN